MVFFEPPRGTAEAVNMSDDNSDGISTDGDDRTPPEYYPQTPAITYETITYDGKEGIVLYPYDPNSETGLNEDDVEKENTPKEEVPSTSSGNQQSPPHLRDVRTVESVETFRNRLNNYINSSFVNLSRMYPNSTILSSDSSSDGDMMGIPDSFDWSVFNRDPVMYNTEDSRSPASSSHS